jgi:hypothetical protein
MPDLNEFLKKDIAVDASLEYVDGLRPCAECDEDVVGAFWDPANLKMSWDCSSGHKNSFQVQ